MKKGINDIITTICQSDNSKSEQTSVAYEQLAAFLNTNRDETTDITGVNLARLVTSNNAQSAISDNEQQLNTIEKVMDSEDVGIDDLLKALQTPIRMGLEWNVDFTEKEAIEYLKDSKNVHLATITKSLPPLNLSKVQNETGKRLNLSDLDCSLCTMDSRDFATLPREWIPNNSPILNKEQNIVQPSIKIDKEFQIIANAVFDDLNLSNKETEQMQVILQKEMVIKEKPAMKAILSLMDTIQNKTKKAIEPLYKEAMADLKTFKGRAPEPAPSIGI